MAEILGGEYLLKENLCELLKQLKGTSITESELIWIWPKF